MAIFYLFSNNFMRYRVDTKAGGRNIQTEACSKKVLIYVGIDILVYPIVGYQLWPCILIETLKVPYIASVQTHRDLPR